MTMTEHLLDKAAGFAMKAHDGQVRKYTGEPYFNHCAEVAGLVSWAGGDDAMIAAALLHDTVEDTGTSLHKIKEEFGDDVAELVEWLTDVSRPSDGNRAKRKEIDRQHLAKASPRAKTIKLADLICNSRSIVKHDPGFAKIYLAEKRKLMEVLKEGNPELYETADNILKEAGY
jgi:(p)ppGpp synthase/HD superfamily hydrolase